ncbi:MAG: DNA polymerase IV [Geminicoccaceae bacterium]|nr:DNA polymerase IV [Geminicoccaceae bacterium]
MDAFYAAVEQRDRPEYAGIPLAVGSESRRGVVLTANYEARRFGVRSAMPSATARRLCPDITFVRPRFDAYREASRILRTIFERHTSIIEPLSLDEAYLDVTQSAKRGQSATCIAHAIKQAVRAELRLTASAGISYNKFLAKLASDMEKPDGLTVIRPEQALGILGGLAIERFHGIGPATARRLHAAGIHSGADLQSRSPDDLKTLLGRAGAWFWHLSQGLDDRPVQSGRKRLSVSVETTFPDDLAHPDEIGTELRKLCDDLLRRCERSSFSGRTLTLKIKYADFHIQTRSHSAAHPLTDPAEIHVLAKMLLRKAPLLTAVRLIGIGIGRQEHDRPENQLSLNFEKGEG